MSDLLALADRVEKLTGQDREVDGEVWFYTSGKADGAAEAGVSCRDAVDYFWGRGGTPKLCYTASLDAAMSLVPEGWAIAEMRDGLPHDNGRYCQVRLWCPINRWLGFKYPGNAATPALALTASALRARAAIEDNA